MEISDVYLAKVLSELSLKLSNPASQEEMFDGRNWREFKRSMEEEVELLEFTEIQKVKWLVTRLIPKVKQVWAKVSGKTADGKAVNKFQERLEKDTNRKFQKTAVECNLSQKVHWYPRIKYMHGETSEFRNLLRTSC